MECHGYRKETGSLIKTEPPCIIHWNFNHFVVFEGIKRGYEYINDPAQGRRRLSLDELDEAFMGIVLTFKPTNKFERQPENNTVFGFMKDRLSGRGGTVLKLLLIGLLLVIPGLAIPAATRFILDNMNTNADMRRLNTAIVFMVTFVIIKVFLNFYRGRVLICLQNKMILQSAYEFVSHLLRLPISFFEQRYAGDLADSYSNKTQLIDSDYMQVKAETENLKVFIKNDKKMIAEAYLDGERRYVMFDYLSGFDLIDFAKRTKDKF